MITITLTVITNRCYAASACIDGRERCSTGTSKRAAIGCLVRAFPDIFLLGANQRRMRSPDLGTLVLKTPHSFGITVHDISE